MNTITHPLDNDNVDDVDDNNDNNNKKQQLIIRINCIVGSFLLFFFVTCLSATKYL